MRWLGRTLPGGICFNNTRVPCVLLFRLVTLRWCRLCGMTSFSDRGYGRLHTFRLESCLVPFLRQQSHVSAACGPAGPGPSWAPVGLTLAPWRLGILAPWRPGALVPRCPNAPIPWCPSAPAPRRPVTLSVAKAPWPRPRPLSY